MQTIVRLRDRHNLVAGAYLEEVSALQPVPLLQWSDQPAVQLGPEDDPVTLAGKLERVQLIVVQFPQFGDGRGYSTARLLRDRLGYEGELRAVGEVFRDVLFYLARSGFDSFLLAPGESTRQALLAFEDFSEGYQASADRPMPLFRRRREAEWA